MRWRQRVFCGLIAILVLILLMALMAPNVITEKRWYARAAMYLRALEMDEGKLTTLKPLDKNSFIEAGQLFPLANDEWMYVVYHSVHRYERNTSDLLLRTTLWRLSGGRLVRDAVLGLGSDGNLYWHSQHVCGGLMMSVPKVSLSLEEFQKANLSPASLEAFLKEDTEIIHHWRLYEDYLSVLNVKESQNNIK